MTVTETDTETESDAWNGLMKMDGEYGTIYSMLSYC